MTQPVSCDLQDRTQAYYSCLQSISRFFVVSQSQTLTARVHRCHETGVLASTCCAYIGSVHLTPHVVKPRPRVDAASTTSGALIFCLNCVCRLCWCTEIARVWRRSTVRVINTDSFHLAILLRWLRCCVYCKFLRTSSRCHKCSSAHVSTQTHCPMQK